MKTPRTPKLYLFFKFRAYLVHFLKTQITPKRCYLKTLFCSLNFMFQEKTNWKPNMFFMFSCSHCFLKQKTVLKNRNQTSPYIHKELHRYAKNLSVFSGGIVSNTLRPTIPSFCDPEWRTLMEQCWAPNPGLRPSFSEITSRLRVMSAAAAAQAKTPGHKALK